MRIKAIIFSVLLLVIAVVFGSNSLRNRVNVEIPDVPDASEYTDDLHAEAEAFYEWCELRGIAPWECSDEEWEEWRKYWVSVGDTLTPVKGE